MNPPTSPPDRRPSEPAPAASGPVRVLAVDWSGAATRPEQKIWLAEVRAGRLVRLESGRDREGVVAHLVAEVRRNRRVVLGLDFGFSFPGWYCRALGASRVEDVWRAARGQGEGWLRECPSPFWGRPGRKRPSLPAHFRATEEAVARATGARPKSVFQIGGAGAVGTGSIRGMPHLLTLADAGFSIFPFHGPRLPLAMEIYPRVFTGPVVKSDPSARMKHLRNGFPELDPGQRTAAASSEDAFDAAVSAIVMARNLTTIPGARPGGDPVRARSGHGALEGEIWVPDHAE